MAKKKKAKVDISEQMKACAGELRTEPSFVVHASPMKAATREELIELQDKLDDMSRKVRGAYQYILAAQGLMVSDSFKNDETSFAIQALVDAAEDRLSSMVEVK